MHDGHEWDAAVRVPLIIISMLAGLTLLALLTDVPGLALAGAILGGVVGYLTARLAVHSD